MDLENAPAFSNIKQRQGRFLIENQKRTNENIYAISTQSRVTPMRMLPKWRIFADPEFAPPEKAHPGDMLLAEFFDKHFYPHAEATRRRPRIVKERLINDFGFAGIAA